MPPTKNALKILEKVTGRRRTVRDGMAQAKISFDVAQIIHDARTKAGLSQSELADLIGSKQPVIARLEDADYEGHSLIAGAFGQRLGLRFISPKGRSKGPLSVTGSARLRKLRQPERPASLRNV